MRQPCTCAPSEAHVCQLGGEVPRQQHVAALHIKVRVRLGLQDQWRDRRGGGGCVSAGRRDCCWERLPPFSAARLLQVPQAAPAPQLHLPTPHSREGRGSRWPHLARRCGRAGTSRKCGAPRGPAPRCGPAGRRPPSAPVQRGGWAAGWAHRGGGSGAPPAPRLSPSPGAAAAPCAGGFKISHHQDDSVARRHAHAGKAHDAPVAQQAQQARLLQEVQLRGNGVGGVPCVARRGVAQGARRRTKIWRPSPLASFCG